MKNLTQEEIIILLQQGKMINKNTGSKINSYQTTYRLDNKKIHYTTFEKMQRDGLIIYHSEGERNLLGRNVNYTLKQA